MEGASTGEGGAIHCSGCVHVCVSVCVHLECSGEVWLVEPHHLGSDPGSPLLATSLLGELLDLSDPLVFSSVRGETIMEHTPWDCSEDVFYTRTCIV